MRSVILLAAILSMFAAATGAEEKPDVPATPRAPQTQLAAVAGKEFVHNAPAVARFRLFVPDGVTFIRGVICSSDYFSGRNVYGQGLGYREAARAMGFAVLSHFLGNAIEMQKKERYDDLIAALPPLAQASGHPELKHAKLVFTGLSCGGRQACEFAAFDPQRCLAFIAIHGAFNEKYGGLLPVEPIKNIPGIFSIAENDGVVFDSPFQQAVLGRKAGAPWAVYLDAGAQHPQVWRQELNIAFVKAVCAMRLPKDIPADRDFDLKELSLASGWLGLLEYKGAGGKWKPVRAEIHSFSQCPSEKADAQWLPDEATAKLWLERDRPEAKP